MQLRRPSFPEVLTQGVCLFFLALFVFDYVDASSATSCFVPHPSENCYPWGGEGPAAGDWYYSSKEAYVRTAMWRLALLAPAPFVPFAARGPYIGVLVMIGLLGASLWIAATLAQAF